MIAKKHNIGALITTPKELLEVVNNKEWIVQTSYSNPTTVVASVVAHYQFIKVIELLENKQLYRYIKNK